VICGPTSAWPWRRRVYEIIEIGQGNHRAKRLLGTRIVALILTNIAAFVAETVPELAGRYGLWFHAFDAFSVLIFTIDDAARLWTAVEVPSLAAAAVEGALEMGFTRPPRHRLVGEFALLPQHAL
jgi:hypothetical protein